MSVSETFVEHRFKQQVDAALDKVRTILENTRAPQYPADVPHAYEDKYHLADWVVSTAIASCLNCLEALGMNQDKLRKMIQWSRNRTVTIGLSGQEWCNFNHKEERKVQNPTEYVTEIKGPLGGTATITDKTFTTVKEWFWDYSAQYRIYCYKGTYSHEESLDLQGRKGACTIVSTSKYNPKNSSEHYVESNWSGSMGAGSCDITWLLAHVNEDFQLVFKIDRTNAKQCRTPRRNPQIYSAFDFFRRFFDWTNSIQSFFSNTLFPNQHNHGLDLGKITDTGIFVPVVPMFEDSTKPLPTTEAKLPTLYSYKTAPPSGRPVLQIQDVNVFLSEQKRSINERFEEFDKMFVDTTKLITPAEAKIMSIMIHIRKICVHFGDGICYLEDMLWKQLVAAIGKEVNAVDFNNYMRFHNRQLFRPEYEPRPFSFAIRRPDHYPEGVLTIEQHLSDGSISEPILTSVRSAAAVRPLHFLLNAATKLTFMGQRHLHAWVATQFAGVSGSSIQLVSRARQFSNYIILIGSVVSADLFEPVYCSIIQNKDEIRVPMELAQIPTQSEFDVAIESLSPEQQRFAQQFRSMQMASSLFGICILQIKPQLEKLLKLPEDSLTKEIKLTQDLMELFIKYQIPSDLISYAGNPAASDDVKVNTVKNHVKAMQDMIQFSRTKELEEQKQVTQYAILDRGSSSYRIPVVPPKTVIVKRPAGRRVQIGSAAAFTEPQEAKEETTAPAGFEDEDLTTLPYMLDKKFEILDDDHALRPTALSVGTTWTKRSQKALLASPTEESVSGDQHRMERNRVFDLLDALSRSGELSCDYADFHVIMAATHSFEHSLMDTVIKDNINPIEKVEKSVLIVATTVQNKPAVELVKQEHLERVSTYSPALFAPDPRKAIKN